MTETITEYLARVRRKDTMKHGAAGAGWRTTREVSDYYTIKPAEARRRLQVLKSQGAIRVVRQGNTYLWRALDAAMDAEEDRQLAEMAADA